MRHALLMLLFLAASCVRVRTASVDYEARRVMTCGNRHANAWDLEQEARRTCPELSILRCGEEVRGAYAYSPNAYSTYAVPVRGTCCVYQCR